jgi:hypothetical protein
MYKVTDDIVIARYITTEYSDSDSDLGNENVFVLQNNRIKHWFAGMSCRYDVFELRSEKYLYINVNTYATSKTTLLKLSKNDIKEVYTHLIFGD